MISFTDNRIVFDYEFCQQCGACLAVCPVSALSFKRNQSGLAEIAVDEKKCIRCLRCYRVCPSNKRHAFENYFKDIEKKEFYLGHNVDGKIQHESSSGGVCKTLIIESLKSGLVGGVYSLQKIDFYPSAIGAFYDRDNIPEYDRLPNSVYHSILQCFELTKVKKCRRLMLVGTSCQLKALETALKGKFEELIKVCIFCKQQKTLDSTRFIAKMTGYKLPANLKFNVIYRGNGWPGKVSFGSCGIPYNRAAQLVFGRHLWTVPGCNTCGDPFGFTANADISLMDPWEICEPNDKGSTLMVINSMAGAELVNKISEIAAKRKSYDEIESALGIVDIKRKQALIPFFKKEKCSLKVLLAGYSEVSQRAFLQYIVQKLPKMPIIFYRALCKFPNLRNTFLKRV